jgi:hypothetical protein
MTIAGIIGTAKNTGKTTALSAIMSECLGRNISMALTSIGYDGEDLDNLTYLPKPKLLLRKDTIAATSELCLKNTKAKFEILVKTDIATPLGKVFIVKIINEGEMVLAGPNNIRDLKEILHKLKNYEPDLIFIDGALNRMAPMYLCDKIIISTGASRNPDIDILLNEIKLISQVFEIPRLPDDKVEIRTINLKKSDLIDTKLFSLIDDKDLSELLAQEPETAKEIIFPNIFTERIFSKLIEHLINKNVPDINIIFYEPFRVLLSLDFNIFNKSFLSEKVNFSFIKKPELIAITVNPFYPKIENFHFKPAYIDKSSLLKKMREGLSLPVYNIFDSGVKEIMDMIV